MVTEAFYTNTRGSIIHTHQELETNHSPPAGGWGQTGPNPPKANHPAGQGPNAEPTGIMWLKALARKGSRVSPCEGSGIGGASRRPQTQRLCHIWDVGWGLMGVQELSGQWGEAPRACTSTQAPQLQLQDRT